MLSKRNVVSVALGFALLGAGLPSVHAGPRHHQDVLISYNAGHHAKLHQVHTVSIRSHGFHGHQRYYSHRPGYGMAAVGLGILGRHPRSGYRPRRHPGGCQSCARGLQPSACHCFERTPTNPCRRSSANDGSCIRKRIQRLASGL